MTSVHDETETESELDGEPQAGQRKITWFDADDAVELFASGAMSATALSPEVIDVITNSKLHLGNGTRVLYQDPDPDGFSLVHAWFGENFPLPRHTHSGDCLYFVLRGELRMGSKTVKAGSGLFVPNGRPYTYRAGVGGVEVLEFRKVSTFDMITLDQDVPKWESYAAIGEEKAETWNQTRPEWVDKLVPGVALEATELGPLTMTTKDFDGKRALVTGAASGIGREIAVQLAARGASVLAADIDKDGLDLLGRDCGGVTGVPTDVTDEAAVEAAVQAAVDAFGGLDIAFNVAGAGRPAPILELEADSWDFVVALVQKGVFLATKHEARAMIAAGGGAIVNISSLNAHMPMELGSSYATAKAGAEMFSKNAALELTPLGVRVNAVLPGLTATPSTAPMFGLPELMADFERRILIGRPATPAEIAAPCLFLASEDASYITGTSLVVDGGWEITNYPSLRRYLPS